LWRRIRRAAFLDPQFVEKVRDIVGLYLDPPERALVISSTFTGARKK
jgi:hypothetical protein